MDIEKLDGLSMDMEDEARKRLQTVFPECFAEGKLDIDKLLTLCGEYVTNDYEKYQFEWKGKGESLILAQKRSAGALRPCPEESVDFDNTKNIYIEGDNLEVLKLLQTAYYRKVKMIYIDPPYNTGNDFVYEDDFAEPLLSYKEVINQSTKSNPETMGRFHTNWLNMMYPRLKLAATLLRDDGVIFISVDDNEVHNLRKLCDETFGEENYVGMFVWQSKKGGGNDSNVIVTDQEYVIAYAKSKESGSFLNKIMINSEPLDREDEIGRYRIGRELNKWGANSRREDRPTMYFPIPGPNGEEVYPIRNDGSEGRWRWSKPNMLEAVKNHNVEFVSRDDGTYIVYEKIRTEEPRLKPYRTFIEDVGTTADGSKLIKGLFDETKIFDFPKPLELIKTFAQMGSGPDDIIMDFFSGSATTAHAVMQINKEDSGNRRFVMVQLPELCEVDSEALKAGYKNICEIGKERIRRAGVKLLAEKEEEEKQLTLEAGESKPLDVGFRVFKLDTSNLKKWDGTPLGDAEPQSLFDRIGNMIVSIKNDRSEMDVVWEVVLKMGVPLDYPVIPIEIGGKTAYSIGEDCMLLVCLEGGLTVEDIEAMAEYAPANIILAENGIEDDTVMSNAFYILKDRNIKLKLV